MSYALVAFVALVFGWLAGWAHSILCERANLYDVLEQVHALIREVDALRKERDTLLEDCGIRTPRVETMSEAAPCPP